MAIYTGVGSSKDKSSSQVGYKAATLALKECGGTEMQKGGPDFVIVFSSSKIDSEELVRGVSEATGNAPMVGCTTAGEITGKEGPKTDSVAVMAIKSDSVHFFTGLGEHVKDGAREAGRAVAKEVKEKAESAGEELKAFIMFPDVLVGNGADAVRGALDELGEHFPVFGGAAGDDFIFEKTFEFKDGKVSSGSITGVGISGEFTMGVGVRHGWVPIGLPMKVTKSEGAVLHELDGKPAIAIYEDYFEEKAEDLRKEALARLAITYPLGIKIPDYEGEYLIRDPITVDENGSITCAAEVPEGSEVRLMIGSTDKAIEAAQEAAHTLMEDFKEKNASPKLVLMFNCIAREKLFAQRADDEIQAVADIIGKDVPLIGFYTYGEIAPLGGEIQDESKINSRFFNETIAMFAIGE